MPRLRDRLARLRSSLRTHAAFGLRPLTAPVVVFLPLGILLGGSGVNLLSASALAHLDVVVSIGLATLGVFIGIGVGTEKPPRRLATASSMEAATTIVIVGAATYFLMRTWQIPSAIDYVLAATGLGICASASAAAAVSAADTGHRRIAAHVADLDDVLPIVLGGGLLAMLGTRYDTALQGIGISIGLGAAIAISGWLLFERTAGAERDVYVLGTLALLGGCAAYLDSSPLLAGLAAGLLWARAPGQTEHVVARHLRKVQHPLVVLLLVIAGATVQATLAGIWLFAPYVLFRLSGKLVGGWIASRIAWEVAPSDLGAYLIPPGVIGIAFALNILQVAPEGGAPIVFAVCIGAIVSEVVALAVTPGPPEPTPV